MTNYFDIIDQIEPKDALTTLILLLEEIELLSENLSAFIYLNLETDSENQAYNNARVVLNQKLIKLARPNVMFEKYIAGIDNLDDVISSCDLLQGYRFFLTEIKNNSIHLLSDEEEVLIAEMNQSGGGLLLQMYTSLTSTLEVGYQGKKISLSETRNLAYNPNSEVRKEGYFAERESYHQINKALVLH